MGRSTAKFECESAGSFGLQSIWGQYSRVGQGGNVGLAKVLFHENSAVVSHGSSRSALRARDPL